MFQVNCVEDIYLIIFGYQCALQGDNINVLNDFLLEFRTFVNEDSEIGGDHDWVRLIRFYSASDKQSIELFGQYLNQYLDNDLK